jgi:hypothetical protein
MLQMSFEFYEVECFTLAETHLPNAFALVPYFWLKVAASAFRRVEHALAALIVACTRAAAAAFAVADTHLPKAFLWPHCAVKAAASAERAARHCAAEFERSCSFFWARVETHFPNAFDLFA